MFAEWQNATGSSAARKQSVLGGFNFHEAVTKLVDSESALHNDQLKVPREIYQAFRVASRPNQRLYQSVQVRSFRATAVTVASL